MPSDLIKPARDNFAFNSQMIDVGLSDLSPEDFGRRFRDGAGSSIVFLVGHLAASRYGLLKLFGLEAENPYKELFGGQQAARDGSEYPSLAELSSGWSTTAEKLHAGLDAVSDQQLLAAGAEGYPTDDRTVRGVVAFLCWHESYHLGQIGMMRVEMGYPSLQARLYEAKSKSGS